MFERKDLRDVKLNDERLKKYICDDYVIPFLECYYSSLRTDIQAKEKLQNCKEGIFLLRDGNTANHYILSYVEDKNSTIVHKEIFVRRTIGLNTVIPNGGAEHVDNLISFLTNHPNCKKSLRAIEQEKALAKAKSGTTAAFITAALTTAILESSPIVESRVSNFAKLSSTKSKKVDPAEITSKLGNIIGDFIGESNFSMWINKKAKSKTEAAIKMDLRKEISESFGGLNRS